jgi:hypothetical protein
MPVTIFFKDRRSLCRIQLGTLLTDMLRALARIGFTNRNAISSKGKKPTFVALKLAIQ